MEQSVLQWDQVILLKFQHAWLSSRVVFNNAALSSKGAQLQSRSHSGLHWSVYSQHTFLVLQSSEHTLYSYTLNWKLVSRWVKHVRYLHSYLTTTTRIHHGNRLVYRNKVLHKWPEYSKSLIMLYHATEGGSAYYVPIIYIPFRLICSIARCYFAV